jgi:hypothetical protein
VLPPFPPPGAAGDRSVDVARYGASTSLSHNPYKPIRGRRRKARLKNGHRGRVGPRRLKRAAEAHCSSRLLAQVSVAPSRVLVSMRSACGTAWGENPELRAYRCSGLQGAGRETPKVIQRSVPVLGASVDADIRPTRRARPGPVPARRVVPASVEKLDPAAPPFTQPTAERGPSDRQRVVDGASSRWVVRMLFHRGPQGPRPRSG